MPELRRLRQEDFQFKDSLGYIVSSKLAATIWREVATAKSGMIANTASSVSRDLEGPFRDILGSEVKGPRCPFAYEAEVRKGKNG